MKQPVIASFICMVMFCGTGSFYIINPPITSLNLGYKEVMRCNGHFAKDNHNYYNKYWFFGRDTVNNCGLIRFEGHQEKTQLPIVTPIKKKRKRGDEWKEVYANDSIQVTLVGHPIERQIQRTFSDDVDFEMIYKGDTLKEVLIGHCRY